MTEQHLGVAEPPGGTAGPAVDWSQVWHLVATTVAGHLAAGRGHLVTQDTVRLAAVLALQALGVAPIRITLGWTAGTGRPAEASEPLADLFLDGPGGTLVDVRLPWTPSAAQGTEAMGWLLRDVLRVASVPAAGRWLGVLASPPLMGQLDHLARRRGVPWPGHPQARVLLDRAGLDALPAGAARALGPGPRPQPVAVTCAGSWPVSPELDLYAFEVDVLGSGPDTIPAGSTPAVLPPPAAPVRETLQAVPAAPPPSPRGTARAEVLAAVRAVVARTGTDVVHEQQVLDEVRRSGARFDEATVLTMLTRHMCAQVQGRGVASYDDVDQVDEHHYRLRPGR
ncbi:hypothetical protein [Nocardioides campestrisoli]|uniref:hypothetical protein n=1 Tax=Nocardioides campestrisoli TaxID=2736757 RepID=UPI0015E6C2E2|nr:hypothetical protein [Nocardioides campestrisoli]